MDVFPKPGETFVIAGAFGGAAAGVQGSVPAPVERLKLGAAGEGEGAFHVWLPEFAVPIVATQLPHPFSTPMSLQAAKGTGVFPSLRFTGEKFIARARSSVRIRSAMNLSMSGCGTPSFFIFSRSAFSSND